MSLYKTDNPSYLKDPSTGLVVSSDLSDWEKYKRDRDRQRELTDIRSEIDQLKQEIEELKKLLKGTRKKRNAK